MQVSLDTDYITHNRYVCILLIKNKNKKQLQINAATD